MFKKLMPMAIASLFLLCVPQVNAAPQGKIIRLFNATTINATATVTSNTVLVKSGGIFGVWYKATSSSGTPDIKIEVEMSYDTTSANFVEPDGMSDIETQLQDENAHVKGIHPSPMKYLRIKCTGLGSNPTDTKLTLYLFTQE
jgi:hypothetical protein